MVCGSCLADHVNKAIADSKARTLICPSSGCTFELTPPELKKSLPEDTYEAYENACLSEYLGTSTVGRCPKCQATFVVDKNSDRKAAVAVSGTDTRKQDKEGKPIMSNKALQHYNENRFRCTECSTSFCTSCHAAPFHAGHDSCDAYALAVSGRQCRWCETVLTEDNIWKNYQCKGALKNTCREADCTKRALASCTHIHKCEHECGGVKVRPLSFPTPSRWPNRSVWSHMVPARLFDVSCGLMRPVFLWVCGFVWVVHFILCGSLSLVGVCRTRPSTCRALSAARRKG